MKWAFKDINFRPDRLETIEVCNGIIAGYQAQGLRLTLRQLYYQLVVRNAIKNEERAYKSLGNLVSDGRLAGFIDWDAIEDRVRIPQTPSEFSNLKQLIDASLYSYRLPRWDGQQYYVELWVEKDAISGVLLPMASQHHVTLMVNRGYSSQSAMYNAADRFQAHEYSADDIDKRNKAAGRIQGVLLYLGDHDPSGEDMVRDIRDRLVMFGCDVQVRKIALTMEQVERYNPPPNPAKMSDSRAEKYIERHGDQSWEVDALPPNVLHEIVEDAILEYIDLELMEAVKQQEETDKRRLLSFVSEIK